MAIKLSVAILALLLPAAAFGQGGVSGPGPATLNSLSGWSASDGKHLANYGTNLLWSPTNKKLSLSGITPSLVFWNTAGGTDQKVFQLIQSSLSGIAKFKVNLISDDGLNATLLFEINQNGSISLTAQTNQLSMSGGQVLLDGSPLVSTNFNEINITNLNIWQSITIKNGATLNLTGGNITGDAFVIVGGSSNSLTNGLNLLSAYTAAKTKTPHGNALSANNRYTIVLLPGIFDLGSGQLAMDTQFIDLIGLSENTGDIKPTTSLTSQGDTIITSSDDPVSITAAAQDITIGNLTLRTTTAGTDSCITTTQAGFGAALKVYNVLLAYAGSGNRITPWDKSFNGTWTDVRAYDVAGSTSSRAFGTSIAASITINGTFTRCVGLGLAWGGDNNVSVTLSGTFVDCWGGASSFCGGSGGGTLSGTFIRCLQTGIIGVSAGAYMGGSAGTCSGYFEGCRADPSGNAAFGAVMSGTFTSCSLYAATGASVTGRVIDCDIPGWNGPYAMNTADSTTITNTASESNFSTTKTINAGDWKVGRPFRWEAWGKYTATNSPGTIVFKTKLGSTAINTTDAMTLPAAGITNAGWHASGLFVGRTISGTGTVSSQSEYSLDQTNGTAVVSIKASNGTTTVANNGALTFQLSVTFSLAATNNAITLENFLLHPLP